MPEKDQQFWFRPKSHGYGWGLAVTWQGWMLLIVYFGLVLASTRFLADETRLLAIVGLTVAFVVVVVLKGERPVKWRRGKD